MPPELTILFISAGFLILGVYFWQKGNHLLKNGKKAEAIVFSNNFEASHNGGGVYYPVVRFLTDKQEWITQELSVGTSPKKREGTKLQVIYDPENPTDVQINSTFVLEILPRIFTALGVMGAVFVTLEILDVINILP
ncbi:Protein of unknown function [Chryseolinea serpens]|uniref:DUF3592 domain-containing protein n=1 Tax=Chryseolinea serpens TaxID=947013 RepID=A0A1M5RRE3_9BACT|nr:DUF3592 domain-containing protein [Chryseolinea serpens]SHH28872.1 Protein of unknown function [Chryseolinea serpens]